jgi:hypothetical protein
MQLSSLANQKTKDEIKKKYNRRSEYSLVFCVVSYLLLRISSVIGGFELRLWDIVTLSIAISVAICVYNLRPSLDLSFLRMIWERGARKDDKFVFSFKLFFSLLFFSLFLLSGPLFLIRVDLTSMHPLRQELILALSYLVVPGATLIFPRLVSAFRLMVEGWRD